MDSAPRRLVTAQAVNSVGDGAFYVTSVLYLTHVAGLSAGRVGLGLSIGWAVGFLTSTGWGAAADRRGARRVAVGLTVLTALALVALIGVGSWAWFVLVICVYGSAQSGLGAIRQALVARLVRPEDRATVRAQLQAAGNAGLAIGAAAGGLALAIGTATAYRCALALDAAAFAATAVVLARLPATPPIPRPDGRAGAVLRDGRYVTLAALNAVLLLYMPMLSVLLPLWVVQRTDAPTWLVSVLFVLNTLVVMLGQVRIAVRVRDLRGAGRYVRGAGGLLLVACLVYAASAHAGAAAAIALLVVAVLVQSLAEMVLGAGAWRIAFDLAPDDRQGEYQGLYAAGLPVARMVGPAALTALILSVDVGWVVLGLVFAAAGAGTLWVVPRQPAQSQP